MTYQEAFSRKDPFLLFSREYSDTALVFKLKGRLYYCKIDEKGFHEKQSIEDWREKGMDRSLENPINRHHSEIFFRDLFRAVFTYSSTVVEYTK